MHSYRLVAGVITSMSGLVALTASSGGCSDDSNASSTSSTTSSTTSSGASGSSPTITAEQCTTRCTNKVSPCPGAGAQAAQGCQAFCQQTVTEAQASCFESKSCEEIARAESIDSLCPQQNSSSGTSGASSGTSGASSGTSGTSGSLPTTLTIKGSIPSDTKAIHTGDPGVKIASVVSLSAKPSFSPSQPSQLPNVADKSVTYEVNDPSLNGCKASIGFTLNGSQVAAVISGTDMGATADCAVFTDNAAKGFKATLSNVPYPNSTTKATVIIDLD